MIAHYLHVSPANDLDVFFDQFAAALWLEKRGSDAMAVAIGKAFGGD